MIPLFKGRRSDAAREAAAGVLRSGYVGQGEKVVEFERELAPWFGNPNVVTVNSGTSAINLALRLAGVGPGDEVITTAMTCTATNMPILEQRATIVWADIDPTTGNMDPACVIQKITKKTKAIMCVHWGGLPCDIRELNRLGDQYGIPVIEDAAHAIGASYDGHPIGSASRFVCFSFQAIKHLTTVDGGALVCSRPEDSRRAKLLRWFGINREGASRDLRCEEDIREYGYKYHMNDVAAAIGLQQLKDLDGILLRHQKNAAYYRERISWNHVEQLRAPSDRRSAYWLFTLLADDRQSFMDHMKDAGVMTSQVHARNDHHTAFRQFRASLPGVDEFSRRQVSIPVGWWVQDRQREQIVEAVNSWHR